ncbi:ABC transporter substrate-binding protein [Limobrevibacterium gyesilva]|uniref:ABC transporter substrate-binding protein n=1 Tax=Limobrevibacterium gyesilva TaxID=2991712 RepID=A0AA42CGQ1_9PROT|nr:ABC transporter substrate-binding protein [Limobrevibacterium gyesilva]MCW3474065.1 ABC transporter substrate-binding protein [Limobrevibacterium gyesilva]
MLNKFGPAVGRRAMMAGGAALGVSAGLPDAWAAGRTRFVTANNNPYDILDPHQVFDIGRIAIRLNMYDALVRWVDNPPKLDMWLAEKVDIAPDGKVYTFTLKPGVKFHDGSALTSEDVVYSMERILGMKKGAYGLFSDVVKPGTTKALDARTVQFNLAKPFAVFMAVLSELWVVNSKVVKQHEKNGDWGAEWLTRNEAGSGGYRLRRFDPAVGFQAERFQDHFAGWKPGAVDDADFRVAMETATRVLGVIKGEFNTTDGFLPAEQVARMRESGKVNFVEAESIRTFYFIINNAKAPLNDVNMRRALCCMFDYDGFINNILGGTVVRNTGIIPNPMWGAPKDLKGYTYDLDKAKWYLSQVKEKLRPLQIGAMSGYPQSEQGAQMLQAGAAKIGFDIKVVTEPYTTISPKLDDPDRAHDLVPLWRSAYFADPHNWTGYIYNSRNFKSGNSSFYKNERVDELTDKALLLTDQEQRRPLYEEASRILSEDAAGLFVYNTKYYGPFTKNVKSVRFCPIGDAQDLRWIAMES